jgi:hypothetical protein
VRIADAMGPDLVAEGALVGADHAG